MADVHPGVLFLLLVAAVPLQFYLSPSATSDVKYYLQRLTDDVLNVAKSCGVTLPGFADRNGKDDSDGEVVKDSESKQGALYGSSKDVRTRSPDLTFRIGDVIKHKVHGYRAVVIGWDLTAQASKEWISKVHKNNKEWTNMPNYAVLIDGRDRLVPQMAYIPQINMELSRGRVNHFIVNNHMERYDEKTDRYVPRPWLREIYPDD